LDIGADHDDVGRGLVRDEKPSGSAAGKCKLMPITIIGHGLTWHFRKTVLNRAKSNHPDAGPIVSIPEVGGLHHRYQRRAA
jgi:hypothetical protein